MGFNEEELKANKVLTEYVIQDLNTNPKLPFEDNSFDVNTNVVSVDYLTKSTEVFKEMHRILKPRGNTIMSLSKKKLDQEIQLLQSKLSQLTFETGQVLAPVVWHIEKDYEKRKVSFHKILLDMGSSTSSSKKCKDLRV